MRTKNSEVDNQLAKHCTVNLVKFATGRGLRGALVATNHLTEVTCNDNLVKVQSFVVASFTKLTVSTFRGPGSAEEVFYAAHCAANHNL